LQYFRPTEFLYTYM